VTPIKNSTHRSVSVSDGRRALGIVVRREDGFAAETVEGHLVGIFPSEPDAASALWRYAVHQGARP
jgi:hypothetical protein